MPKLKGLFSEWDNRWWPQADGPAPARLAAGLPMPASAARRVNAFGRNRHPAACNGAGKSAAGLDKAAADRSTSTSSYASSRVWRRAAGPKIGFLAGYGGLPRWVPFLDRAGRERTVIVPSLPGFPGGDRGHTVLDTHLDWVLAVARAASTRRGSTAPTSSAARPAARSPPRWRRSGRAVKRLALIAPFGLFDEKDPTTDPWAQTRGRHAGPA